MPNSLSTLRVQRWDDHRLYHHSRVNQTLHLISALSFLVSYAYLVINPAISALIAWCVAMTTRQIGHFVFEPRNYDERNHMSFEEKEDVKLGYNLQRKTVLLTIWMGLPVALWIDPTALGYLREPMDFAGYAINVGWTWFWLGLAGAVFRTVQLFVSHNLETGLVWLLKIITDPFHDIKIYWKAPFYLLKGEWVDPNHGAHPF